MAQKEQKIAIICWNTDAKVITDILPKFDVGVKFDLFVKHGLMSATYDTVKSEIAPYINQLISLDPTIDTQAKAKNYTLNYYKSNGYAGYVHLLEDSIEVLTSPTAFMSDVENMMDVLDINSYFGTITDVCNKVYNKYCPRLKTVIDKPEHQKFGLKSLLFCSHSNTQWMTFNIGKADADELHFNEDFTVAMFWIIEYLARRRNSHPGSMYFMNQYATVESEVGVYRNKKLNLSDATETPERMKKEDEQFKALNVNFQPDNNIDIVLERLLQKLNSKV